MTRRSAKSAVDKGVTPLLTWVQPQSILPSHRRPRRRTSANWVCSKRALSQAAPGAVRESPTGSGRLLRIRHLGFPPVARTRSLPVQRWTDDASVLESLGAQFATRLFL